MLGQEEKIIKQFTLSSRYLNLKMIISLVKWAFIFSLLVFLVLFWTKNQERIIPLFGGINYELSFSVTQNESTLGNETGENFSSLWLLMAGFFLFLATPLIFFYHFYYLRISNEFLFTDQRILIKKGWIGTKAISIHYNRITDVSINQGVLDRILGIGSLYISTAGSEGDRVSLFHVSHPHKLKKELYDLKGLYFKKWNGGQNINEVENGAA